MFYVIDILFSWKSEARNTNFVLRFRVTFRKYSQRWDLQTLLYNEVFLYSNGRRFRDVEALLLNCKGINYEFISVCFRFVSFFFVYSEKFN